MKVKVLVYLLLLGVAYSGVYHVLLATHLPKQHYTEPMVENKMFEAWRAKNLAEAGSGGKGLTAIEEPLEPPPDMLAVDSLGRAAVTEVQESDRQVSKLQLRRNAAQSAPEQEQVTQATIKPSSPSSQTENPKTVEEWGSHLASLQMNLDAHLQALMLSHKQHEDKRGRGQSTMEHRIRALHEEACSNPLRGDLPSCHRLKITDADFFADTSPAAPQETVRTTGLNIKVKVAPPAATSTASAHVHDHDHHSFADCIHSCKHAFDHKACTSQCKKAKDRERDAAAKHIRALDAQLAQIVKDHHAAEHEMNDKANAILRELCAEPFRRGTPACKPFETQGPPERGAGVRDSAGAGPQTSGEWGARLGGVQAQLDTRLHHLSDVHSELRESSASDKGSMKDRIEALQDEMCADPRRHSRPMCKKLLAEHARAHAAHAHSHESVDSEGHTVAEHMATFNADLAKIAERHADAEKEINEKAKALGREMCADQSRRHTPSCAIFFADGDTSASVTAPSADARPAKLSLGSSSPLIDSRGEQIAEPTRVLHMHRHGGDGEDLDVPVTKQAAGLRGVVKAITQGKVVTVGSKQLLNAHWAGHIPKVACIMSVPASSDIESRLRKALENFRAQKYEGPKELILIYKHQDKQVEKLVHTLADGFVIKHVAAHNDEAHSTTSLRFGAWHSDPDAEIIARWDIDDWHHPQRLALQVRALGFTDRPACVLKRVTEISGDGAPAQAAGGLGWAGTLVGERAWMEKHWYPLIVGEDRALEASLGLVAQLDMPELALH